ncbi:MAG: FUSC family protein [Methylorubrum rhodinum]|uniref:FUSC family protein n=1 Tax=Methylorubrum rhodinum TaxID=29428 RepID=UPI003BAF7C37
MTAATSKPIPSNGIARVAVWSYLLHGLRVAASILLALAVSYNLALDNGFWSGITAAVTSLPSLGTSLRKGRVRVAGTFVAALVIIAVAAAFPQDRFAFFVSVAIWCGLCGFVASLLRNFGSYGAALGGFTAAVIFTGVIDNPDHTFLLAMNRALEICIGVISASVVLIVSDTGGARGRLARALTEVASEVADHLSDRMSAGSPKAAVPASSLVRRIVSLDDKIDEAFGDEFGLRQRASVLHAAVEGLFASLAASEDIARLRKAADANPVRGTARVSMASSWRDDPVGLRAGLASRSLEAWKRRVDTPEDRALADRTAAAMAGLAKAANGLTLVAGSAHEASTRVTSRFFVPDVLPALIDGLRALLAVLAAEMLWVGTGWSGGQACITFAAVSVTVFSPLGPRSASSAFDYCVGTILAYARASIVDLAVLPRLSGFAAFATALTIVLIPLGALSATPWRKSLMAALLINTMAILSLPNQPVYDPVQFLNFGMSVVAGAGIGALAMRLLPPLSSAMRADRLVDLSTRDLRRLAVRRRFPSRADWTSLVACRLEALPDGASPRHRANLLTALAAGGVFRRPKLGLAHSRCRCLTRRRSAALRADRAWPGRTSAASRA